MPEEGFFGAIGRIAGTFVGGAPDAPRFAWNAVAPWFNELTRSATTRWLPHLVLGIRCEVVLQDPSGAVPCVIASVADCAVCRRPCCLDHSFVSKGGEAICYPCAHAAYRAHAPKMPGEQSAAGQREPRAERARARSAPRDSAPGPPPPSTEEDLRERAFAAARKELGVKASASWADVESAYKALLKKHHPDRYASARDKATHSARFVKVRAAYDFLMHAYPEATR